MSKFRIASIIFILFVSFFPNKVNVYPHQRWYLAAQLLFDTLSNDCIEPNWDELVLSTGKKLETSTSLVACLWDDCTTEMMLIRLSRSHRFFMSAPVPWFLTLQLWPQFCPILPTWAAKLSFYDFRTTVEKAFLPLWAEPYTSWTSNRAKTACHVSCRAKTAYHVSCRAKTAIDWTSTTA
jgi:hypothetical protein